VVDSHDSLFRGVLTGSALVGEVESIRFISPDVAVVHAFGSVLMPWRSELPRRGCHARRWSQSALSRVGGSPPSRTPGSAPCGSQARHRSRPARPER
jgi:hypothetical protein